MSKKNLPIIVLMFALSLLQSCSVYNTLFPKRPDNYINYNVLFADPETNNALRNKRLEEEARMDNKIRIITINKITNDTIIEWVDPIEITGGKKMIIPAKEKIVPVLETEFTILTKESEIIAPHKAIIFQNSTSGTFFQERNDTLFVSTSSNKMEDILLTMLGKNIEPTPVVVENIPEPKEAEKNNTGKNKLKNAVGNIKKKVDLKNKPSTTEVVIKEEKPKEIVPEEDDIEVNIDKTLPNNSILANSNTLVGDLNFDTDNNAITITDTDSIKLLIKSSSLLWQTMKCKTKVRMKRNDDNKTFVTHFRMKKDTATWASLNLPVVGELARVLAKPDSVAVLDKWKDKYYNLGIDQLQSILNLPIPYSSIQDYIIGNSPLQDGTQMLAKKSNKGVAIKIIKPGMSCVLTYNADSTLKAIVVIGNTNGKSYSIKNTFSNYEDSPIGKFSTSRNLYILENGKETIINLEINKPVFNEAIDFPFTIPAKFKDGTIK